MTNKAAVITLIIIAAFYSCSNKQSVPAVETENISYIETAEAEIETSTRAELIMRALAEAYPDQIKRIEFRDNDWAVLLRDKWYYYAEGRLLPENQLENTANFRPSPFYNYPEDLPPWRQRTPEETERFSRWETIRRQNPLKRSNFFLDDLWQAASRTEIENNLVRITFLGKQIKIHKLIQNKVASVETQIITIASNNPQVQTWIDTLGDLEGYGWRNIAGTQSRSYHSYGLAVDLLPKSLGRLQTYWLWTSQYREDWWNVSYNERYHPPAEVIKAFETNGFIWGGKWPLFDTMHFEYRPEVIIFNGLPLL